MSQTLSPLVSSEILRIAKKFDLKTTTVSSMALANSRQYERCINREKLDQRRLEKLRALEASLDQRQLTKRAG